MKRITTSVLFIIALLSSFNMSGVVKNTGGTFSRPDFAYPKSVDTRAREVLSESLPSQPEKCVQALIQIIISETSISGENFNSTMLLCDSVSRMLSSPYSQIVKSLQAQAYRDYYQNNRWNYDGRVLPLDQPWPDSVEEWSGDMFALKVIQLADQSCSPRSELSSISLGTVSHLLTSCSDTDKRYMPTVYDLLAWRALNMLQSFKSQRKVIPFSEDISKLSTPGARAYMVCEKLYQSLLSLNEDNAYAQSMVYLAEGQKLNGREEADYLLGCYRKLSYSPASMLFLAQLQPFVQYQSEESGEKNILSVSEYYKMCEDALKKFPSGDYAPNVKNTINALIAKQAIIKVTKPTFTADSVAVDITLKNINECNLLLVKMDGPDGNKPLSVAAIKPVKVSATIPFSQELSVVFPPVEAGYYVVLPSSTNTVGGYIGSGRPSYGNKLRVGSLSAFVLSENIGSSDPILYVINAREQRPEPGIEVKQYANSYNDRNRLIGSGTTDLEGGVLLKKGMVRAEICRGKEVFNINSYTSTSPNGRNEYKQNNIHILTDLALYHPGDSIGFAVIAYKDTMSGYKALKYVDVKASLFDMNGSCVDTIRFTTDVFGRGNAKFRIPQSGVTGNYTIQVSGRNPDVKMNGACNVKVAEYVAPTFFVELDSLKQTFRPGDDIIIKGQVKSYSGMPLGGAAVSLNVTYSSLWRWIGMNDNATYGVETTSDADGRFIFSLPTANLKGTEFEKGIFTFKAIATSPDGESEESDPLVLALGQAYTLTADVKAIIDKADQSAILKARVINALGVEQNLPVRYKIFDLSEKHEVANGVFTSPQLSLPVGKMSSGRYRIDLILEQDSNVTTSVSTVLYSQSDTRPPYTTSLWLPQKSVRAEKSGGMVNVTVGNSYSGEALLCVIANDTAVISRKWIYPDGKNMKVKVNSPASGSRIYVNFVAVHDFQTETGTVVVEPVDAARALNVKVESFRDKITPGTQEKWSFRFTDTFNGSSGCIPALAVMTDKALNAIYDFKWYFSPKRSPYNPLSYRFYNLPQPVWYINGKGKTALNNFSFDPTDIYTYNKMLYAAANGYGMGRMYKTSRSVATVMSDGAMKEESAGVEMEMASANYYAGSIALPQAQAVAGGAESAMPEEAKQGDAFRDNEHPLAFFRPELMSDADGRLDISFTVPDFNTTWQFQLLGYDSEMRTASSVLYSVASKPVMVKTQAPRFLRTDDRVDLRAILFNNSAEQKSIYGIIEVYDLLTDSVLAAYKSEPVDVSPMGSVVIAMPFLTPSDKQMLGIRTKAISDNFTDGEQSPVSVLPSSSPVFESMNFYLGPDVNKHNLRLPDYKKGSAVTLQYCDNPVWYCITALPDIASPQSDNLLSLTYAYFGNALASSLVNRYPDIARAISLWQGSQMLTSPLSRNEELKTMALDNTIWVRNAQSETLRMGKLINLLDTAQSVATQRQLMQKIAKLQNADGGWSWMHGMKPSLFLTSNVLLYLGQLKQMNALSIDENGLAMIDKAIQFADKEVLDYIAECRKYKSSFPTQYMLNYFYIRSFYENAEGKEIASLRNQFISNLKKDWRNLDIYNAATAAITLARYGQTAYSRQILESLRQKALSSPEKGVWFDNLRSTWSSFNTLITTAQVLEAFAVIEPSASEIDGIRQWLVLQRQSQQWGDNHNIAEVIYAVMSSGSDWTASSKPAVISLNGRELKPDRIQKLTGEFTLILDAAEASGAALVIEKNGSHPAWGGVLSQYIQPMADIKAYGVQDLSVKKETYVVRTTDEGEQVSAATEFKVGDIVRVTLTITCGHDMEYVAVTDERPACLQPIQQLPRFTWQDGVGFYVEPRTAQTNIFVDFLPKGVHTITYDCYVSQAGDFASGIATAQSQYAPMLVGHSAGRMLKVRP